MSARHELGRLGEDAAVDLLERAGCRILARNWREGSLELDIVAQEGNILIFVEVRTRAAQGMVSPVESLNPAKCRHWVRAAQAYMARHACWSVPCRFDMVSVRNHGATLELEHNRDVDLSPYISETVGRRHTAWQPW